VITDTQAIGGRLQDQRWFGYKGRTISGIELVDEATIDDGPPALVIALIRVVMEGGSVLFQLPLLVEADGSNREATEDPERLRIFGDLMAHGDSIKGASGVFHFGGPGLDPMAPAPGHGSVRVVGAEQSNTSIVLDEEVILKFFRKLDLGPNPDLELNRLLTSEGFDNIPSQVGEVTYEGEIDGAEATIDLGIAQQLISDGTEGWTYLLQALHRFYDEVDAADIPEDRTFLTEERARESLDALDDLGDVTASLHVALSRDESNPDLAPEAMTASDLDELVARIRASLTDLPATALKGVARILKDLGSIEDAGTRIRVHGDYHLGQVLKSGRGWMILDFEGEPLRPLEERRAKLSPLKDVAGMLRSFSYVATAALFERTEPDSEEWERLAPWGDVWEDLARDRFLTAYLTRAHEGRFLPVEREGLGTLLDAFEIEKALYELEYEKGHRPDWIRIPERGIVRVAERVR
jgi:predicted trehalose synthase